MSAQVSQWWKTKIAAAIAKNPYEDAEGIKKAGTWLYARTMASACCELIGVSYPSAKSEFESASQLFFDELFGLPAHEQAVLLQCVGTCQARKAYEGKDAAELSEETKAKADEILIVAKSSPYERVLDDFLKMESNKQLLFSLLDIPRTCSEEVWKTAITEKLSGKDSRYHKVLADACQYYGRTVLFPPPVQQAEPSHKPVTEPAPDVNAPAESSESQPDPKEALTTSPAQSTLPSSLPSPESYMRPPKPASTSMQGDEDKPSCEKEEPVEKGASDSKEPSSAQKPSGMSASARLHPAPSSSVPSRPRAVAAPEPSPTPVPPKPKYAGRLAPSTIADVKKALMLYGDKLDDDGVRKAVKWLENKILPSSLCSLIGADYPTTYESFRHFRFQTFGMDLSIYSDEDRLLGEVALYYQRNWKFASSVAGNAPSNAWRTVLSYMASYHERIEKRPELLFMTMATNGIDSLEEVASFAGIDELESREYFTSSVRDKYRIYLTSDIYSVAARQLAEILADEYVLWPEEQVVEQPQQERTRRKRSETPDDDEGFFVPEEAPRTSRLAGIGAAILGGVLLGGALSEDELEAKPDERGSDFDDEEEDDEEPRAETYTEKKAREQRELYEDALALVDEFKDKLEQLVDPSFESKCGVRFVSVGKSIYNETYYYKRAALGIACLETYGPYATGSVDVVFYSDPAYLHCDFDPYNYMGSNAFRRHVADMVKKGFGQEEAVATTIMFLRGTCRLADESIEDILKKNPDAYDCDYTFVNNGIKNLGGKWFAKPDF